MAPSIPCSTRDDSSSAWRANSDLRAGCLFPAGLGGMSGAQGKAAVIAGAACIIAEVDPSRIETRFSQGWVSCVEKTCQAAFATAETARAAGKAIAVAFQGNIVDLEGDAALPAVAHGGGKGGLAGFFHAGKIEPSTRVSMRLGATPPMQAAPAMMAALPWAPDMPPRPDETKSLPPRSPFWSMPELESSRVEEGVEGVVDYALWADVHPAAGGSSGRSWPRQGPAASLKSAWLSEHAYHEAVGDDNARRFGTLRKRPRGWPGLHDEGRVFIDLRFKIFS